MKIKPLLLAGAIVLNLCLIGSQSQMALAASDENKTETQVAIKVAPKGVSVAGRDVSGMNVSEVKRIINQIISGYDETVFTLIADGDEMEAHGKDLAIIPVNNELANIAVSYGSTGSILERYVAMADLELGKKKDFGLSLTCDWNKTKDFLSENTLQLASAPVDSYIVRENGGFKYVEGTPGIVVDAEKSATIVSDFITNQWTGNDARIQLETIEQEPRGSREELGAVKDLLGSCSTDFSSSSKARAANVKNGTGKLNGKLIYPGESFSVSTNLQSRNAENGYLPAPSYENGTTVDTYGGGVCQISSTLYNAVIRSELEILERHPHSMVVSYVKPSMDAAISEGSKDFVFKNNTNYPIYIEGYTNGGMLYFNIFGKDERPSGRSVSYVSEVLTTTDPGEKFVEDASLPAGTMSREQSAHTGYTARLWKVVSVDGVEQSRDVFNNSSYRASAAIYRVGTMTDNPELAASIKNALSSQNRETIKAAGEAAASVPAEGENQEGNTTETPAIIEEPAVSPEEAAIIPAEPIDPGIPEEYTGVE